MAWNGSDQTQPKSGKYRKSGGRAARTPQASSPLRGLLAALIVVAGAAAVWWFFLRPAPPPAEAPSGEGKAGAIAEAKPEIVTNAPAAEPAPKAEAKPEKPKHPGFGSTPVEVDENGDRWVVRNGRRRKVIRGGQVGTSRQLWFNKAENVISALVTVKPGDTIVGFDLDRIKESFAQSMANKIEFSDKDTPEEREEKELVKEAKENLAQMVKDGGDLEEILREEYGNVMRMYNYRHDLVAELNRLREEGATAREMDDYVKAANKMLAERGIENPVRLRPQEIFELKSDTKE